MSVLAGKRIVITRATHQATALENLLRQYQAIPVLYPCIAIITPEDTSQLDTQLSRLESYDWLILTSTNTVHILKKRLSALNINPDWTQFFVATVGDKTAHAFAKHFQHYPHFIPDRFSAKSLAQSLPINNRHRVFIPQSALADDMLSEILTERGADVTCVDAYETILGEGGEDVPTLLKQRKIDVLTFTSPSTVENFMQRIYPLRCSDVLALCIGSSTAATAKQVGFQYIIVPDSNYSLQGMLDALILYYQNPSIKLLL